MSNGVILSEEIARATDESKDRYWATSLCATRNPRHFAGSDAFGVCSRLIAF